MEFVRTTWKEWHEAHPETGVYIGALPNVPKNSAGPSF
jgi:hypothetical protein